MPPDTGDEIDPKEAQDAEDGSQGDQTPGDQPEARQPEVGDRPEEGRDDSDDTSDPLLLAQMEPETAGKHPQSTPKQAAKSATKSADAKAQEPTDAKADQAPEPEDKPEAQDPDEAEALADLPPEDWSKVSHKAKSQFLAQRKVIRANAERLRAEAQARRAAEEQYQSVEKFVREVHGLSDEEYVNTVAISGMIKRNDPQVIPVLQATLASLRKATGQPEEAQAPLMLDDDLAAVLKEAEECGIDTGKVRARFQPATQAAPPAIPAAAARVQGQQVNEAAEYQAIQDTFQGLGLTPEQAVAHVHGLIQANPQLASVPPGQRLRAVMAAHSAAASKAQLVATRKPTQPPLVGRRAPMVPAGRTNPATVDPLAIALPGR